MLAEHLFFATILRIRENRFDALEDRMLADAGLTRADVLKQNRLFRRKGK